MLKLNRTIAAGGAALLEFTLYDLGKKATISAGATAFLSAKKRETRTEDAEVVRRSATIDVSESSATVTLTSADTTLLGPTNGLPAQNCEADLRIESGNNVIYYEHIYFAVEEPITVAHI